jgi:membrane-bound lytic murein transglycosylase B
MGWKDKISGAFGVADAKFASHAIEAERAAELLEAASKEEVGFADYLSGIEDWLKSKGCRQKHIDQEMVKVKDVSSYLKHD